ncbi:3-oxoacyl-[acyl-carrier-protein] synthase-3 [Prosthecobacter fusiformis]|uniref:Beta-ketoacyl-[acyl-carrier-protein] synthase III n=1 Tax=Prosthecobacter fusiformis TaxID=48464 RepID=A0A4R7S3Q0_9BACT|nr:beta-ketoacyl-ACP synthase III [Prosthecobacter fusiformis]TDU73020.1 3-oxoacyl-[acyl-carrier-protein] synthase-3 [Prosthecobacter fusiformis]
MPTPSKQPFCTSSIIGTGSYMPEKILTNEDLSKFVDTSDEWITSRTGIKARRIAADDQATSDLASEAARRAMAAAGVTPEEINLIVVATVTPDMFFPSTACFVQKKIGASNAVCFDISAACSGFLYALQVARHFINTGNRTTALVIGAEKLSSLINWQDRNTCVLFGDGAGAVVIRRAEEGSDAPGRVLSTVMGSDGNLTDLLKVPGGASACPITPENVLSRPNTIHMEGRETFKHAVTRMCQASEQALEMAGLTKADIAMVIPHQANARIITAIADRLGVPPEKTFINLDQYGNTSAATIPVALDEAHRQGKIKRGDIVLLVAFGGGFTWASSVVKW